MAQDFTLDDFRRQLLHNLKMDMKDLDGYKKNLFGHTPDPSEEELVLALNRLRQMIAAMTDEERSNPDLIDSSRRTRIATSSGTHPQEVEQLLAQFDQVRAVMRQMASMSLWQRIKLVLGFDRKRGHSE